MNLMSNVFKDIQKVFDENLITMNKITRILKNLGLEPYKLSKSGRVKGMKTGYGDFDIYKLEDNKFKVILKTKSNNASYPVKLRKIKEALKDYENVIVV